MTLIPEIIAALDRRNAVRRDIAAIEFVIESGFGDMFDFVMYGRLRLEEANLTCAIEEMRRLERCER